MQEPERVLWQVREHSRVQEQGQVLCRGREHNRVQVPEQVLCRGQVHNRVQVQAQVLYQGPVQGQTDRGREHSREVAGLPAVRSWIPFEYAEDYPYMISPLSFISFLRKCQKDSLHPDEAQNLQ